MSLSYDAGLPVDERKRHGVFYTPEPVVRYLLRATAPAGVVADLSCGDGAFLVEAARAGWPVMGIDRDEKAVALAEARLAAFSVPRALQCGDGLQAVWPWTPDVVLGNPPYLEAKKTAAALKARCRALFPTVARGAFDLFICFLQAGLDALPPGGRLGYILPNKFLIARYAQPLRERLLAETTIEQLIDVSDLPTFRDAAVYPVLLVIRKTPPPPNHRVRTGLVSALEQLDTEDFPRGEVAQARWGYTADRVFWLPPGDMAGAGLVDRLLADPGVKPLSHWLDIRWTVSFHRAGLRDRYIFPQAQGNFPRRWLGGDRFQGNRDVRRYRTSWSGWWIDYDEARARADGNPLPPAALFHGPKLLIAQNARRLLATLDTEDFVSKDTFLVGRQREMPDHPSLICLLALLNSALMSYLYAVLFKATHVNDAYLHYLACYLNDLPIRLPDDPTPITTLATRLLDPTLPDVERRRLDRELDDAIYELYELTPVERAVVEGAVAYGWGE